MASFMPQDVFDVAVVTAIKLHVQKGTALLDEVHCVCAHYQKSYPDDVELEAEMQQASAKASKAFATQFNHSLLPSAMTQLQFCITSYELDGKKRRRAIFGGTWFTRSNSPNPRRVEDCLRNLMVYHVGTISGDFPLAPEGWSLSSR